MSYPWRNPKPLQTKALNRHSLYKYYAGYSVEFVEDALAWVRAEDTTLVVDPWVGSGTTSLVCTRYGIKSLGFDLNPAAIVIAKAKLIPCDIARYNIMSLVDTVIGGARVESGDSPIGLLDELLDSHTASAIRRISNTIIDKVGSAHGVSSLTAFLLVGLFSTCRVLLKARESSNPTWTRMRQEKTSFHGDVFELFKENCQRLVGAVINDAFDETCLLSDDLVRVGDARQIDLGTGEADSIITSPPYLTRLDYAMALAPELSIIGYKQKHDIEVLRRSLTGTTSRVPVLTDDPLPKKVDELLIEIGNHPSHGSKSYYEPTYRSYFADIAKSLSECARILRLGGRMCMVVQDSYYKERHIDLPDLLIKIGAQYSLKGERLASFSVGKGYAKIHPGSRKWGASTMRAETIIGFIRR